jgi:hypothetical protein
VAPAEAARPEVPTDRLAGVWCSRGLCGEGEPSKIRK